MPLPSRRPVAILPPLVALLLIFSAANPLPAAMPIGMMPSGEAGDTQAGEPAATTVARMEAEVLAKRAEEKAKFVAEAKAQSEAVAAAVPQTLRPMVRYRVVGLELWRLAAALAILLLALCATALINYLLHKFQKRKEREKGELDQGVDSFWHCITHALDKPVQFTVWAVAIQILTPVLLVPPLTSAYISEILLGLAVAFFAFQIVDLVEYYLRRYAARTENKLDDMLVPMIRKSLRILVVIVAGLHIYQTVTGAPITTLVAGLGLGGIAFALAAQDTLKNIFGFVMIVLDQPFVVGDRIVVDGHDGCVEQMGFRSTRIRRLDGHLVTVPNSKMADYTLHNIGRRPFIRRIMNVTITYDTPVDKIQKAVEILQEILKDHEGMDPEFPPRVYFNEFNAESLNIMAIYWYHPPDYWGYMDHAQRVNFELMRRYEAEGIEFAFPTQTLYLAGDPNRELVLRMLNEDGGPARG